MAQGFNSGFHFLTVARRQPSGTALSDEARVVSYAEFADITLLSALHMDRAGVRPGDLVGVRTEDPAVLLSTLLGSAFLGARWVSVAPGLGDLLRPKVTHFFTSTEDGREDWRNVHVVDGRWSRLPEGTAPDAVGRLPGATDPDAVWIVSPTSGTTGTPKLVGLSHRVVTRRNAANAAWFDAPGRKVAGLFPMGAPAAISRHLAALVHGGEVVAAVEPVALHRLGVDHVFGSPAQVQQVFGGLVLPAKLPLIHLLGATAPEQLVRHLLKSFERVANGYGSTEAHNSLSTYRFLSTDGTLGARTEPRPGVAVEIVDEADLVLPRGREGIVRIRSDRLADGYLDNPAASAAAFREGCFYPGDLGLWTEAGDFVVTGRVNDQFNLGGVKLNAALLDFTLQNLPGIEDAVSFLLPRPDGSQSLRAMVRLAQGVEIDQVLAEARVALIRVGGRDAVPEKFLFADEVPRNAHGKPDRAACISAVLDAKEMGKAGNSPK